MEMTCLGFRRNVTETPRYNGNRNVSCRLHNLATRLFNSSVNVAKAFKVPVFRYRNAKSNEGVPAFDKDRLQVKNKIGQGRFGEVYTTEYSEQTVPSGQEGSGSFER